jgi:hypothetical protein
MIMSYSEEELKYIKESLEKEERKPVGMFGLWAYYAMKKKEFNQREKQ